MQRNDAHVIETPQRDAAGEFGAPVSRALVVDDDPDINRLVQMRLKARGYLVDSAANGEQALERLDRSSPDLMFLDVSMPGLGGLDLLERINPRQRDLAVIMMTAFGSEQVAVDALRRGADDYLRKPFERQEFQTVLDRTVSRLELRRQNTALRAQLDDRRRQLEAELARAGRVQAELLPHAAPRIAGFEVAARCLPARDVGGDFYDWQEPEPGLLTLTLGDVMGKGMPAALLMATVRAALRAVSVCNSPATALEQAGRALEGDLERSSSFVTLFHARLDAATRRLDFVDAGHGHVFVRRADGTPVELGPRALPLGVLTDQAYEQGALTLEPGDALVLYSDGLIDARPDLCLDSASLATRLQGAGAAQEMVDRLIDLAGLAVSQPDDLTIVVLYCCARQ